MSNTNLSSIIVSGLPTNLDEADSAYWRSLFYGLARRLLREKCVHLGQDQKYYNEFILRSLSLKC